MSRCTDDATPQTAMRVLLTALLLVTLLMLSPALPVRADTLITVTTTDDDPPSALNLCATDGMTGPCTLRDAIYYANAHLGTPTIITLPAAAKSYLLTRLGNHEDNDMTGDLDVKANVTITGGGAATTIIDGNGGGSASPDRVFDVFPGTGGLSAITVSITGVTIQNGYAVTSGGGGLFNSGNAHLTLTNCVVDSNTTTVASTGGGGIINSGASASLTLVNTTVSNNKATGTGSRGGGIYNNGGTVTVTNSTVAANTAADAAGGGIANEGTLTVTNSTLSGNHADSLSQGGGGIYTASGMMTVTNSTFSTNTANGGGSGGGGGIYNLASTLMAINTLIAGNTATGGNGPDFYGAFVSTSKNNLLGDGSFAVGIANNDANHNLVGTTGSPINPLLDSTLRDNGTTNGTQTLALLSVLSPANNAGDDATCANTTGIAPVAGKDQRGVTRPQPAGGHCDIGAYELIAATAVALTAGPNPATVGQTVTFTATVTGTGGTPTGSVTFKDGTTVLGGGTLFSGVATFVTSALAVGSHAITAVYSGDSIFVPSTSAVLTQVVGVTVTGITVTAPAATVAVGGTDQFMATCTYSSGPPAPCTTAVTWTSDTLAVATVNATGLVTGVAAGTAKISATIGGVSGSTTVTVGGSPPPAGGLQFYPLSKPVRLLDTRAGATAFVAPNAPLTAGQTLSLPGQFSYNGVTIPSTAQAIVGNATVANGSNGTPAGFATIFPSGVPLPLTSNLNFVPGTVRPNDFTVALGADTKFNLYSSSGGDFVIDLSGYYAPVGAGGLYFHPLTAPVRELDTRSGAAAFVHPNATLTAGQTLTLPGPFTFNGITVPAGAKALVGNATVANNANGTPAGFATLYPDDVPLPLASNLNFVPGTVAPNAFTVALGGGDGGYDLYTSSGGDFVIDITGYLDTTAAGGLLFTPLDAPVRELDTRAGASAFVHPNATLGAGQTLNLPGSFTFNSISVPGSAQALVGNATVANDGNSTPAGFATLYPDGVPLPLASNLNFVAKQVAPNAVVVGIGGDGKYDLYTSSGGDFIIDISGYYAAPGGAAPKPATTPAKATVPTATPPATKPTG